MFDLYLKLKKFIYFIFTTYNDIEKKNLYFFFVVTNTYQKELTQLLSHLVQECHEYEHITDTEFLVHL